MSKGKKKKSGNGAGAVAFGVTFVLLSSIFKIHGLFSLAVQLAVSAFVSAVIRTMAQGLDLTTEDQKKKMAEGINKLNEWVNNGVVTFRTNEVLKKVKASAIESENIGQEALGTLENQRESLSRSINKVDEVKTNANQAKQLLRVG